MIIISALILFIGFVTLLLRLRHPFGHTWGKWSEPAFSRNHGKFFQERKCTGCNIVEQRELRSYRDF